VWFVRGEAAAIPMQGEKTMTSLIGYYSPLDRMFDRAFGALLPAVNGDAVLGGALKLDVVETPDAYVVKADAPGASRDKIDVKVEDRDVTIGVDFGEEAEANGKALWTERRHGKLTRALRLPEAVDAGAAVAKHVDGVLQLTLPKLAKAKRKQITIQ
jgi:HSP20 family protein